MTCAVRGKTRGATGLMIGAAASLCLLLAPAQAQQAGDAATVQAAEHESLGTYLTDDAGRTLYTFDQDTRNTSECQDFCTNTFRPYTVDGRPTASGGAVAALLGTLKREDGSTQVSYSGHPLYTYAGDYTAGGTAGHGKVGFGGRWSAIAPGGEEAVVKAPQDKPKDAAQASADQGGDNPFAGDTQAAAAGQDLYLKNGCYGCHGRGGGGGMGPSLIGTHWRYGGKDADLFQSITEGRANGMPAWRPHFNDDEVWQIITFLRSLAN